MSGQLSNVNNEGIKHLLGNRSLNSGVAVRGTSNAADTKYGTTINYILNGVYGSKAATESDISTAIFLNEDGGTITHDSGVPATLTNVALPDLKSCKYLLCYNGTIISVVQGAFYDNGSAVVYPSCPPGYVSFYVVTLVNTSGAAFTFGATTLATGGIADSYENVSVVPSRNAAA